MFLSGCSHTRKNRYLASQRAVKPDTYKVRVFKDFVKNIVKNKWIYFVLCSFFRNFAIKIANLLTLDIKNK